jgi:glycine hydroxymethyltransferase
MVPFDKKSAMVTSGIRIGTAAVTTRGFTEEDCRQTVAWIDEVITNYQDEAVLARIKQEVHAFMANFPLYENAMA